MATWSPFSTSPASTSARTRKSWAACTTWPSRSPRRSGPACAPTWTGPRSPTRKKAACPCTSATPTAPAWNSSPTPWARCTAATSCDPSHDREGFTRWSIEVFVIMKNRARGALYGLAIGDALGMPTQLLSRREIVERWGEQLQGFEPAPPGHRIAAGLPAGAITDDTEQAVLLGRLLVKGHGTVAPRELAQALVSWERDMAARGSLDLLGPSTKRAVAAVLAGVPPEEAGASGATNGAAMRIPPLGVAVL